MDNQSQLDVIICWCAVIIQHDVVMAHWLSRKCHRHLLHTVRQHSIDIGFTHTFMRAICGNNSWMIKWKRILRGLILCSSADCRNNDISCVGMIAGVPHTCRWTLWKYEWTFTTLSPESIDEWGLKNYVHLEIFTVGREQILKREWRHTALKGWQAISSWVKKAQ